MRLWARGYQQAYSNQLDQQNQELEEELKQLTLLKHKSMYKLQQTKDQKNYSKFMTEL